MTDAWVVLDDIGLAPAIGQKADDELDRQARTADHGLAGENGGIENDTVVSHGIHLTLAN